MSLVEARGSFDAIKKPFEMGLHEWRQLYPPPEVFNVDAFKSAHAYCTAARIYEASLQLDVASSMRDRCDELMHLALRSVALDLDGDGVIDSGELDLRETGGSSRDLRASWSGYNKTDYDKTFVPVRAMRH